MGTVCDSSSDESNSDNNNVPCYFARTLMVEAMEAVSNAALKMPRKRNWHLQYVVYFCDAFITKFLAPLSASLRFRLASTFAFSVCLSVCDQP